MPADPLAAALLHALYERSLDHIAFHVDRLAREAGHPIDSDEKARIVGEHVLATWPDRFTQAFKEGLAAHVAGNPAAAQRLVEVAAAFEEEVAVWWVRQQKAAPVGGAN